MPKLPTGTRKRDNGTFEKRFSVNGKRFSVYANTLKELAEKEQETRERIKNGQYKSRDKITLNDYFVEWTENRTGTVKASTLCTYKSIFYNNIPESIRKQKIKDIEKRELMQMQKTLAEKKSIYTANYTLLVVNMLLSDAVRDEITNRNPAENIKALKDESKTKATETIHRALTEEEQHLFFEQLKKDNNFYYEFFAFLLCTGLRFGECASLRYSDIDEKNNIIHITKTLTKNEKNQQTVGTTTKTKAGKRDIPLTETAKKILQSQRGKSELLQMPNNFIFLSINNKIASNKELNRQIKITLKHLAEQGHEINYFSVHCFRDTFATRFIEQGGNLQTLKTILGHSSLSMTADLYAHVLPNTKQQEMDKIKIII